MKKAEQIANKIIKNHFFASVMFVAGGIPANACIFNNSNKLAGAITPGCIKKFELAMNEIKKIIDDKSKIEKLEDALQITKAKYSANFLNVLIFLNNLFSPQQKNAKNKIEKIYKELYNYCTGSEVFNELVNMVVLFAGKNGIKFVKIKKDNYGSSLVFEYNSKKWYVSCYREEFLTLFRKGSHQFELLCDAENIGWFNSFKVRGGIKAIVKVIKDNSK